MENTLQFQPRLFESRIVLKLALFCAMLIALLGAPAKASAQTLTMNSGDAHAFANALVKTTGTQDKLNALAAQLIKVLPYQTAWTVARIICYNGINQLVATRIHWCADRASRVYIYTAYWIPYWADKG